MDFDEKSHYTSVQSQKHLFEYLCARCAKLKILSEDRKNMSLTQKKNSKESNNDKDIINVEMTNTVTIETKPNKKKQRRKSNFMGDNWYFFHKRY